ncbi:MAG TPA: pirin family protein [Burkholderiales bacterium]|nr:pirin family protein [Burkholderiales bacterium]
MIELRKSCERGHVNHGWLDSFHSFSFADYHDPQHVQFGALRVINEDRIEAAGGFGMHGHRDMEIITYLLAGRLEHKDSIGNGSVIHPGDVQRMSAGRGVMHSEFNPSRTEPAHLLQIWLLPEVTGIEPGYEQKHFDDKSKRGRLCLVASRDGRDGSLLIHQDAALYAALLDGRDAAVHRLAAQRKAYVHVARGQVAVNGQLLEAGDAAKITATGEVTLDDAVGAEVLLFDLADD